MPFIDPVDLMNPPTGGTLSDSVAPGEPVNSGDFSSPLTALENELQYNVTGDNMVRDGVLRGESFSKNGLTEVFTRKARSESWTTRPANDSQNHTDIPGGALRFRLRAPADVHVFFTATISRLNKTDMYWTGGSQPNPVLNQQGWEQYGGAKEQSRVYFRWLCNALWEGSDGEPGRHYLQAQTYLASEAERSSSIYTVDKVDVARSLFFPWKIRVVDGLTPAPVLYTPSIPPEGEERSRALSESDSPDKGRLQAGWHNIRHTMSWVAPMLTQETDSRADHRSADALVFGNTELVVVANYGAAENISTALNSQQNANALHQRVRGRNLREVKPPKKKADE